MATSKDPLSTLVALLGKGWATQPSVQKGEALLQHNGRTVAYAVLRPTYPAGTLTLRTPNRALNLRRVPANRATAKAVKDFAAAKAGNKK